MHRVQTHTVYTMQIGKNRHNRQFIASLEVEQQAYRHFLNTIVH